MLTTRGKKNLLNFLGIILVSAILLLGINLAFNVILLKYHGVDNGDKFIFSLIPALLPAIYLIYKYNLVSKISEAEAFTKAGFVSDITKTFESSLVNYKISEVGDPGYLRSYLGQYNYSKISIYIFSLSTGSGKSRRTHKFFGIEYTVDKPQNRVQIYGIDSPVQPSFFNRVKSIDSNEFLNAFNLYAEDEKAVFYQFDPDTMADLTHLTKQFGYQYNIEFNNQKVLIFCQYDIFINELEWKNLFGLMEIINELPDQSTQTRYQQAIGKQLSHHNKIFKALDLHLKV